MMAREALYYIFVFFVFSCSIQFYFLDCEFDWAGLKKRNNTMKSKKSKNETKKQCDAT